MTVGVGRKTIPGVGTFFVGIDLVPGVYRCEDGKNGWWVRFIGPNGDQQDGLWPLPPGPAEVVISDSDFAFETHVPTPWRLITPLSPGAAGPSRELRPVVEPGLRDELDVIAASPGPLARVTPVALILIGLVSLLTLQGWAIVPLVPLALTGFYAHQMSADVRRARALRLRRDRYLVPEDFDGQAQALLVRVQDAIGTVLESEVNQAGLLDSVDNAVTLPRQEWEIAQVLVRQSRLRAEQDEAMAPALPAVEAALRPLRRKLDLSVQAATRRVESLERYADRTRAADEVLRAQRQLDALAERAHVYDELLAESVRDDLALPAIERLSGQSDELLQMLRSRLVEAAEAAEAVTTDNTTGTTGETGETGTRTGTGTAGGGAGAPARFPDEPGGPTGLDR